MENIKIPKKKMKKKHMPLQMILLARMLPPYLFITEISIIQTLPNWLLHSEVWMWGLIPLKFAMF